MFGRRGEPAGCAGATHEYFSPDTVALSTIEKDVVFAVEGAVDLKKLHRSTLPKRKPGNLLLSNVVSWNRATDGEHHVTRLQSHVFLRRHSPNLIATSSTSVSK